MELQLGLKISRTRDDVTSHSDLRIDKNHAGPLFLSRETDAMFFLIAYLKGFRRENMEIDINKEGDEIAISGKRAVQEMVLSGWIMHRKDVEFRAFRKVFRIPDGINLDKIKAEFNDDQSTLTIIMPKSVKGMRGLQIEEVEESKKIEPRILPCEDDEPEIKEVDDLKSENEEVEEAEAVEENEDLIQVEKQKEVSEEAKETKSREVKKGSKLCPPLMFTGSALLISLIVLVISLTRAKRK